jgi:hypothetical protein
MLHLLILKRPSHIGDNHLLKSVDGIISEEIYIPTDEFRKDLKSLLSREAERA